jgi:hypothetical protein
MKRFLLTILTSLALVTSLSLATTPALAINVFKPCSTDTSSNTPDVCQAVTQQKGSGNPVIHLITTVITVLSIITGAAAILIIVISGLRIVVANGDSKAMSEARTGIIGALVGLAIVALAQVIVAFVLDKIS